MNYRFWCLKYELLIKYEKFMYWFVRKLPKELIFYCFMHVCVFATTGKHGNTQPGSLDIFEIIKRWKNG